MSAAADRNLLFGVVALQMDFISRDALLAAMHSWVADKTKSLGEILVAQKALTTQRRDMLAALVEEHIKQHDDSPQRSLQSISSLQSVRAELLEIADSDVQASIVQIPADVESGNGDGQPAPDRTLPLSAVTSSGTRFRFLRPWREGGLGKVSVAQDEELHREVALKEIKYHHARSQQSRDRFLLEAEVTGALEHPGIVPVYGLGHYADGRPFYAMRFIRGDSLEEAIERFHKSDQDATADPGQRTVAFRELLGRFIDVCNAIAYAHSRGVLHRDLKPGNIILGKYGETLVVDWGLAKVQGKKDEPASALDEAPMQAQSGSGSAPTRMGSIVGTPAYMSPEQAEGRLDLLGPPSDVYSLGATLYCLLTGVAPFTQRDITELLSKVRHGEFPRPRQLGKTIAPPLEAICLKAMAAKPTDRYATPIALADDLEHWLADEPVSAYREPLRDRTRRWARRHRAIVTGAAVLVMSAAVALCIATVLIRQQQVETEAQRQQAVEAKATAERNQDLAERRAKQLSGRFMTAVQALDSLAYGAHWSDSARDSALGTAQRMLTHLLETLQIGTDADADFRWAHAKLGEYYFEDGKFAKANDHFQKAFDKFAKANDHFQKAFDFAKQAATSGPGNVELQRQLAHSYTDLGRVSEMQGNHDAATGFYRSSLEVFQRLANAHPNQIMLQADLSNAYSTMGSVAYAREDDVATWEWFKKSLDTSQKLLLLRETVRSAGFNPSSNNYPVVTFFEGFNKHDSIIVLCGKNPAVRERCEEFLDAADKVRTTDPEFIPVPDLARSYGNLAEAHLKSDEFEKARDLYSRQRDLLESLPERGHHVNSELLQTYQQLCVVFGKLSDEQSADKHREKMAGLRKHMNEVRDRQTTDPGTR